MQTEVPVLPVVYSDGHKCLINRKTGGEAKGTLIERAPYKNSIRMHGATESTRRTLKNPVGQRIISAKSLRMKELQNQLSDAHYHLNELANENRLLKALQKRQDSALKRYEGANAELPRIINSHHEELKVLQIKYKRLKAQHKQTSDLLKEKENEMHVLQSQNKHLLQLSKDKQLGEREKLQMQVSDLNHRIDQQQETIQNLNRKLTLESKSLKHQLSTEVTRHRETQKQLNEALDKLKNLEELLDNREKRLYQSGQLPAFNKRKALTTQSLTNLGLAHLLKSSNRNKDSQQDLKNKSLPKLPVNDSSDSKLSSSKTESLPKTETMASLQQIRKFRLQKSGSNRENSGRALTDRIHLEDNGSMRIHRNSPLNHSLPADMHKLYDVRLDGLSQELADQEINNIVNNFEKRSKYRLSKQLMKEYNSTSDSNSEEEAVENAEIELVSTSKSRNLHSQLINGLIDNTHDNESRQQIDTSQLKNHTSVDNRIVYKRDIVSSSESDESTDHKRDEEIEEISTLMYKKSEHSIVNQKRSLKTELETSQERLLSITKSWTDLQEKIKRGRETSEHQLRGLDSELTPEVKYNEEEKLLRYFEKRREDEEEVELEIAQSHDKSRRGTFGLEHSHFSLDNNQVHVNKDNGYSLSNESDSVTNGESSSRENETPETGGGGGGDGRKSSDGLVEANINNFNSLKTEELTTDKRQENKLLDKMNYNKDKLLAAMKAIDDNENIEFLPNKTNCRSSNSSIRSQVTENLYRGLPTHAKKRDDIIKDIFSDTKVDKLRSGCTIKSRLSAD